MLARIFITDHRERHTQAIIKSFQDAGYLVYGNCVDERESLLFNLNGWIAASFYDDLPLFLCELSENQIKILVPVGIKASDCLSRSIPFIRESGIAILLPRHEDWISLHDKQRSASLAKKIGVPIPETQELTPANLDSVTEILPESINMVVKATRAGGARFVRYAHSPEEIKGIFTDFSSRIGEGERVILQEYIEGEGCAYFALANNGHILREFGHLRIRENPPTGGASTCCRSFYHPKLFSYGRKLVEEAAYTGVIMIEFKYNRSKGEFYFIEINPKFWGSFLLSILAGIHFELAYAAHCCGKDIPARTFKEITLQFALADIRRWIRYKKNGKETITDLFSANVYKDIGWFGLYRYLRFSMGSMIYKR